MIGKIARKLIPVLATVAAMVTVSSGIANADNGDRFYTDYCNTNTYDGVRAHANLRNCTIVWGKNVLSGEYWQTVTFDLLDAQHDGYCAQAQARQQENPSNRNNYWNTNECDERWETRSHTFGGRAYSITLAVGWGQWYDPNQWVDVAFDSWYRPSGF